MMSFRTLFCKRIFIALLLAITIPSLSGCDTPSVGITQESENIDENSVEGQLILKLREVLIPLSQQETPISKEEVSGAIFKAGFDTTTLEIQDSTTPTGLQADSLSLAIPTEDNCIFGYIRDKNVATAVLPKLESGDCFVGGRRR